jgi:TolA-binding protein
MLTCSLLCNLISLCILISAQSASNDFTEADRLFQFAGQLMEEEDYYRAITEYKRFISYFPKDQRVPLSRFNIAVAYKKGGKADLALEHFQQIPTDFEGTIIAEKAAYEIGTTLFASGRYTDAEKVFSEFINHYPRSNDLDSGKVYLAWSLIHLWELDRAADIFSSISEESSYYPIARALAEEIQGDPKLPRKSPVLAGIMSGVLPGAGQVYTGRYNEGLTSFVLNGTFIWAIVELFNRGNEVAGILLGFFEVGWYTGGVFGAVNNAHKYNRKARSDYLLDLQNRFPLPPSE